ncbi:MAG TPA: hypothetical protein VJM33_07720 [Microthrixaceae bacterium]|nr:hypothetical protein [Microthrixaceae bacterium]
MAGTSLYDLADRVLDGRLAEQILERRQNGESYQGLTRWLLLEHDITVSIETVRKWTLIAEATEPAA